MTPAQTCTPGTLVAQRYRIISPLGNGGMGNVYLAIDEQPPKPRVAIKQNTDLSAERREQFLKEVQVLASLSHPNLPAVLDCVTLADGQPALVMEYIDGETLQDRVQRRGPLAESMVLDWAAQILDVLIYLHAQEIVHRDITPNNIRLTPRQQAYLVDFGISKHSPKQTAPGARCAGTPGYAPVEQYFGGTDARSDIYALGATLYFALTGQPPVDAKDRKKGQRLPAVRELNPAISPGTAVLIEKAMAFKARRRFASATQMREALVQCRRPDRMHLPAGSPRLLWTRAVLALICVALVLLTALTLNTLASGEPAPQQAEAVPSAGLSPMATATPPPTPTLKPTAKPTLHPPTSTPAATATAKPGEAAQSPLTTPPPPSPTPAPELKPLSPGNGVTITDPVTLRWEGPALAPGEVYRVTLTAQDNSYARHTSTAGKHWTIHLAPRFGWWTWQVTIVRRDGAELKTVAESERHLFCLIQESTASSSSNQEAIDVTDDTRNPPEHPDPRP